MAFGVCVAGAILTQCKEPTEIVVTVKTTVPFQIGDSIGIDSANKVYVGGSGLVALSASGVSLWSRASGIGTWPAIGTDGTLYFTEGSSVYAYSPAP